MPRLPAVHGGPSWRSKFIGRAMPGGLSVREIEDVGAIVPTAAEFMALATGDPLIMERVKLEQEIRNLELLRSAHEDEMYTQRRTVTELRSRLRQHEIEITLGEEAIRQRDAHPGGQPALALEGYAPAKGEKALRGADLKAAALAHKAAKGGPFTIGSYKGFRLLVTPALSEKDVWLEVETPAGRHTVKHVYEDTDEGGLLASLSHLINKGLDSALADARKKHEDARVRLTALEREDCDQPFAKEGRLKEATERYAEILAEFARREAAKAKEAEGPALSLSEEGDMDTTASCRALMGRPRSLAAAGHTLQ